MNDPEWLAKLDRHKRFMATELGTLYRQHEHALIAYWQKDADDGVSTRRLRELDEKSKTATQAFVARLMELAGV
jgi:hypothetical protein